MDCALERQGNTLYLKGPLTILTAASLRTQLLETETGWNLLNLSGVTALDWAGTQILIALKRSARESGSEFAMAEHSESVLRIFNLMGLAGWFADPILRPARLRDELPFAYGIRKANS